MLVSLDCFSNDEQCFDDGINAVILNYDTTLEHDLKSKISNAILDLSLGFNFNAWRFRQKIDYDHRYNNSKKLSAQQYSLSRDINLISSKLLIGDSYLPSNILDGFPFKGIMLKTNDKMNYSKFKIFAPEIRGIAKNKSEVKIYQYGELIYSKQVNSGNFIINDIVPFESSGELEMVIRDISGEEYTKTIPYQGVSNLNPNGVLNYLFSIGEYRGARYLNYNEPNYFLGTFSYGVSDKTSFYLGVNYARDHLNTAIGLGALLGGFGSLSVDLNSSKSIFKYEKIKGDYFKLQYGNTWSEIQTDFYIITKYNLNGQYLSFDDYVERKFEYDSIEDESELDYLYFYPKPFFQLEGRVNKNISDTDSLYFSLKQDFFKNKRNDKLSFSAGYSGEYKDITFNFYGEVNRSKVLGNDKKLSMDFSIPINFENNSFRLGYSKEIISNNANSQKFSISGDVNDNLYYNVSSKTNKIIGNDSIDASLSYESNAGKLNIGLLSNNDYKIINNNLTGSVVLYDNKMLFGEYFYDSAAIVQVPGYENIEFDSHYGIKTNSNGYVIIPDLNAYRENKISIDYSSLPDDAYLEQDEVIFLPNDGAIIYKPFILNHYEDNNEIDN